MVPARSERLTVEARFGWSAGCSGIGGLVAASRPHAPVGRCECLVLDLSRNLSLRYCSTTCANRNAVAAYRARGRNASA